MSRVNPIDAGMPAGSRADKAGSAVGFEDLRVRLPRRERECPRCGRTMTGHGSFPKEMAHAVGRAPCRLEVKVPRSRCKSCGVTVEHVNSARAESANDKIKEPEKRGRGFGGFAEMRKRLLIAFGRPDAIELPTARKRR